MIKRTVLPQLEKSLSLPEITILTGPRQVGKTFLMHLLQESLEKKGEKTIFLSLDFEDQRPLFESQNALLRYIRLQVGESKAYIFIDEIQRMAEADLFLKGLYDMSLPYKFIVSGSGSLELKSKIKESLAGRKRIFIINPISLEEFVNFKTDYHYEDKLQDFFEIEQGRALGLLEEYMIYGGYPRVVLAETVDQKRAVIEDIYVSYIEKDITGLLDVEKPEAFTNLVKLLAAQVGSLVNVKELSSTLGISEKTVPRYLWYLEQTFIIKKLTPYYHNVRSEISKAPVYYFFDTGLRNYLLGLFGLPSIPEPFRGHLFENVIFNILREGAISPTRIHFWRTRDKAEVDFVLVKGLEAIPMEAKYTRLEQPEITRSYHSFLARYKPKIGYIVALSGEKKVEVDGISVYLLPYYRLLNAFILTDGL